MFVLNNCYIIKGQNKTPCSIWKKDKYSIIKGKQVVRIGLIKRL